MADFASKVDLDAPQIIEHITQSINFTPFETRWIPASAKFVLLGQHTRATGAFQIHEMSQGKLKKIAEIDHPTGLKCGSFGASAYQDRHFATGDCSGNLDIWDLSEQESIFSVQAHSSIINCLDGCGGLGIGAGAQEIVTGSRDGYVKVWDPRVSTAVASLEPKPGQQARDCWAVCFGNAFNDEERCVCAGYDNGDVKLLDLRTNKIRWEVNVRNGVVGMEFDRKDIPMNKLVVTSLDSQFRVFDMRTQHPFDGFTGLVVEKAHDATVWLARHLPQNRDLFGTTGGNGTLNIYKYRYPEQRAVKSPEDGHMRGVAGTCELLSYRKLTELPIASLDWSADKQGLCVLSGLEQVVKVVIVTKLKNY